MTPSHRAPVCLLSFVTHPDDRGTARPPWRCTGIWSGLAYNILRAAAAAATRIIRQAPTSGVSDASVVTAESTVRWPTALLLPLCSALWRAAGRRQHSHRRRVFTMTFRDFPRLAQPVVLFSACNAGMIGDCSTVLISFDNTKLGRCIIACLATVGACTS